MENKELIERLESFLASSRKSMLQISDEMGISRMTLYNSMFKKRVPAYRTRLKMKHYLEKESKNIDEKK